MTERPRGVAYDDWWPEPQLMSGSAHYVSNDRLDGPPVILVPDGQGDCREHEARPRPQGRMGFR